MLYEFIATDVKLPTFQEALEDEQIKSYNELLAMGLTDAQIAIRGIDLSKVDRDEKVFLIMLPEELENSPLIIEPDFHNVYARYLTAKKYIYKVMNVQQALAHFLGYIGKYALTWRELEIWRVQENDYLVEVPMQTHYLHVVKREQLEQFFEASVPCAMQLMQK